MTASSAHVSDGSGSSPDDIRRPARDEALARLGRSRLIPLEELAGPGRTVVAPGGQQMMLQMAYFDRASRPVIMEFGPVLALEDVVCSIAPGLAGRGLRWERLLGPDGLAVGGVAGAPGLDDPADDVQAAAEFVERSGVAQARRDGTAVVDLAADGEVLDDAQPHGRGGVADGVGDELADDQFGGLRGFLVHVPGGELAARVSACPSGSLGGGAELPRAGPRGCEGVEAGGSQGSSSAVGARWEGGCRRRALGAPHGDGARP